jgi:hypothetical protein
MYANASDVASLPSGWPVYPTPVDCQRCGGRIHQMSLRRDSWCSACLGHTARLFADAAETWYTKDAA